MLEIHYPYFVHKQYRKKEERKSLCKPQVVTA